MPARSRLVCAWATRTLLAFYTAAVLWVTLRPTPVTEGNMPAIRMVVSTSREAGAPDWFDYYALESLANVAMFFPLGFLLALVMPKGLRWVAPLVVCVLSAGIELIQATLIPSRDGNIPDVIANSVGGWLGVGVALALRSIAHATRKRRTKPPQAV